MNLVYLKVSVVIGATAFTLAAQSTTTPKQFFENLITQPADAPAPAPEILFQVTDQLPTMSAEDVAAALPAIFRALEHLDDSQAITAAFAVSVVARRTDSATVLRPWLRNIGSLLNRKDARISGTAILAYMRMDPHPAPQAVPALLAFLDSDNGTIAAKPDAVRALLTMAPNDPHV